MKKVFCDICHKDCGDTYYKVKFEARCTDDESYTITASSLIANLQNIYLNQHLCEECKSKIEQLIKE